MGLPVVRQNPAMFVFVSLSVLLQVLHYFPVQTLLPVLQVQTERMVETLLPVLQVQTERMAETLLPVLQVQTERAEVRTLLPILRRMTAWHGQITPLLVHHTLTAPL